MNQKPPVADTASLIERASEIYGLREALRGRPVLAPLPEAPVASPVAVAPSTPVAAAPVAPTIEALAPTPLPPLVEQPLASAPIQPSQSASAPEAAPTGQWRRTVHSRRADVDLEALGEAGFIVPGAPPSPLSEEFRIAKRHLLIQAFGGRKSQAIDKGRLILMCSAQPNEGKTFCSVNLALSLAAETDVDVLLIDADVAKPEVLSTLGLPGGPGLMDALADPSIDPETLVVETNIPNLSVLPAGRQTNNDTELLASDRTPQLIERLIADNPRRVIVIDSAPALAASPASSLALHVGQITMIVRADQTSESEVREALAMLESPARVQLILNRVTYVGSSRKFGYYYGFGEKS
jgi:protein-tyrosine kinase